MNNQRRFKVKVNLKLDDEQATEPVTVNAYQPGVEKAFELKASGNKTRVLIDSQNSALAFWVDSLTIV